MTSILKAALISAIFTGFSASTMALDTESTNITPSTVTLIVSNIISTAAEGEENSIKAMLPLQAKIGIAHIHNGQITMGSSPHMPRWNEVGNMSNMTLSHITPRAYLNALTRHNAGETYSKDVKDDIRLAAIDSDLPYVFIYESEIGAETNVTLLDSHSGQILGVVRAQTSDSHMLTTQLENLIDNLSQGSTSI